MNYHRAKDAAQKTANKYRKAVILFSDTISNVEDTDGPWGYAVSGKGRSGVEAVDLIGKWRDKSLDERISPQIGA